MEQLTIRKLYTLSETIAEELLEQFQYPWEVIPEIHDYILRLGKSLPKELYEKCGEDIWIAKSASVAPTASITGPAIIDEEAEVRHCAFIRGNAIVGKRAVVGNSTELKNVILFNQVQVPHYNYVGDSILGFKAHMGAGAVTSNIKSDKTEVTVNFAGTKVHTGLVKCGALIGDVAEIGCNSVLNPGTVIGPQSTIYPLSMVREYVPANSIYKKQSEVVTKLC